MGGKTLDQFRSRQARAKDKDAKDNKDVSTHDANTESMQSPKGRR